MTELIAEIVIEDMRNSCRVCLAEPHRSQMLDMNLIYDAESQLTFYDCFEICTNHDLRQCGEYEPHTICRHCGVELQWAYDFHKKVALAKIQLNNVHNIVVAGTDDVLREEEMGKDDKASTEGDKYVEEEQNMTEDTLSETEEGGLAEPAAEPTLGFSTQLVDVSVNDIIPRQRHFGQFSCPFCNKLFRNLSHMQKHRLIHLADRPQFYCEACDRVYLTKQALKVHVDTQHTKSGRLCSICGKVFAIAKGLEIHMRYHNGLFPFDCDQCDRKFAQRSHLTVHQQVQHSSARFLCEFPNCGKLFTSSSALRNHECTHTEMPFECNVCQQGFPARYKLRLHAQRRHNTQLTLEQLETMRKFHIIRSKRVLAKIDATPQQQAEQGQVGASNES